jgi:phosphate-selective porin
MTKSICSGLLAFAVLSSIAMAQEGSKPAAGGWSVKPGSGIKYDGGEAFSFNMVNQLQVHWTFTALDTGTDTANFTIRRARTTFSGHVFDKGLRYKLQLDAADAGSSGDGAIKEGHVTWQFQEDESCGVGLRFGQGKVLYGFEGTGSSSGLFFVERSSASRGFADGYSRGAWLVGSAMKNQLRWSAGVMNTDVAGGLGSGYTDRGEETSNSDNEMSYTAMVNFDPLGDFNGGKGQESFRQGDFRTDDRSLKGTVGVGIALGNGKDTAGGEDIDSTSINLNTAWSVEGFQVIGEYYMRSDDLQGPTADTEDSSGWAVSGTYLLPKGGDSGTQWGVGLRVGQVSSDNGDNGAVNYVTGLQGLGAAEGDSTEVTVVVDAFYHGHMAKSQIEYTFQDVDFAAGNDPTNHILRIGFQLLF